MTEQSKKTGAIGAVADLCALAGAGLLSYGAWMVYEPAGVIVAGVLLLVVGVLGSMKGGA